MIEVDPWQRRRDGAALLVDVVGHRGHVRFDDQGKPTAKEVFAEGWLQDDQAWGRPVDIKELGDGSLLVSDDYAGMVYRISYGG